MAPLPLAEAVAPNIDVARPSIKLSPRMLAGIAVSSFIFICIVIITFSRLTNECRTKRKQETQERCMNNECPWYHCWRSSHDVSLRHKPNQSYAGSDSELEDLGHDASRLRGLPQVIEDSGDYLKVARGSLYNASCPNAREKSHRGEVAKLDANDVRLHGIKKRAKYLEREERQPSRKNDGTLPLVDSSCSVKESLFIKRIFFEARFREPPAEELAGTLFPGRNRRNPRRDSETLTPQQAHARTMLMQEQAIQHRQAEEELEDAVRHCNTARRQLALSDAIDSRSVSSRGSTGKSTTHTIGQGRVLDDDDLAIDSPVYALTPREGESSSGIVGNGGTLSRTSSNGGASVVPGESDGERGVFVTTFHPVDNRYTL